MREMVGGCCVCSDDRGWSENPLVYCDGQSCNVAVHQACYGIVTVPTGPWFCCKCESQERPTKVKCELCPSKYGALKRTDNQGWAHVVCALYIPEVRFGNVSTMEPIQLQLIPAERFNKVCYICEEKGKGNCSTVGACMQCNKIGCKQQFHVTCAQSLGLLCEEAGNYLDNVKYCGYCQHHYSKLKKGGNVKTIPPYKPVSETTVNSDSEKESEAGGGAALSAGTQLSSSSAKSSPSQAAGKRKSSSSSSSGGGGGGAKSNSNSKVANTSAKSSGSQQKTVHSNNKGTLDKKTTSSKVGKTDDTSLSTSPLSEKSDKKDKSDSVSESDKESSNNKESKGASKKRKVNSRTPTPIQSEVSGVVGTSASSDVAAASSANFNQTTTSGAAATSVVQTDKRNSVSAASDSSVEKNKKTKVDTTQSILSNQPVVALTSISNVKLGSSSSVVTTAASETVVHSEIAPPITPSIIQTAQAQAQQQQQHQQQSLLVSVPLASTSLSPHHSLVNNQTSGLTVMPFIATAAADKSGSGSERATPVTPSPNDSMIIPPTPNNNSQGVLTSEMSGGGLKITYEKQPDSINTVMDMELEMDTPTTIQVPARRGTRSQSSEKTDRTTRGKKRNSLGSNNAAQMQQTTQSLPATMPKRSSRSQHASPPPAPPPPQPQPQVAPPPGAFAAISQEKMKDSPPSSPNSESQGPPSGRGRTKGRKSAQASSVNVIQGSSKEEKKDVKIFQNGMTTAPHMLGNQLNPTSNMHQKMTDHLSNELEAHSIYHNSTENSPNLIGPQMHHKVIQSTRASSTGSSTASGGSGLSSMLGGGGGTIPQTLDQLLERQWEQGSQFLMEQAQHFDIASLLSCLHQLRAENLRLEDHVTSLIQRRDHLLAVNARLAIPLTGQPITGQPQSSHTVNNVHPSMSVNHVDMSRSSRHNSGSYDRYPQSSSHHGPLENGIPPEAYSQNPHRSPVNSGQPSPTVRHSPAGSYSNNGLLRQCADVGGRAAPPRSQSYQQLYDRPGSAHSSSSSQQMVMRREREPDIYGHGSQPS